MPSSSNSLTARPSRISRCLASSHERAAQRAMSMRQLPRAALRSNKSSANLAYGVLIRLLEAAGYNLKLVKAGHERTVEDILDEQRSGRG